MKPKPAADAAAIAQTENKLARLGVEVETMQAVLVRLLQDVVRAETQLGRSHAEQLVAVNERLVVAALASQADAEKAAQILAESLPGAELDPLTKLQNRASFTGRALDVSAQAKRSGERFALLFIDLDAFKQLNDTRGHAFGDRVLEQVARRMQATVRQGDIVSRHGGDEFLVLLPELTQAHDAQLVAEKLAAAVAEPLDIDGTTVRVTASVGIAIYPDDGEDFQSLVAHADAAMYQAKRLGPGTSGTPVEDPLAQTDPEGLGGKLDVRQENLRLANERLLLAALSARELQAAAERARARQATFIAAVAEELRDAQSPIRIASAMLGRQAGDEALLPRLQGLVDEQMTHIARLLDNLVSVAKVPVAGAHLQQVDVDLSAVIVNAVAAMAPALNRRGQTIDRQQPDGPLPVSGDEGCLLQIVGNLLDNASKHTHDGGQINLSVTLQPETLTLTVADNGIGIHPTMLSQVFDPFMQDTHALGFNGIGVGIGLTAARTLAQGHGGDLTAHSDGLNRGSRFVLTLPLRR